MTNNKFSMINSQSKRPNSSQGYLKFGRCGSNALPILEVGRRCRAAHTLRALIVSFVLLGTLAAVAAEPAPELDALFQRTNGWIGADGDYSIPLNSRVTLWLFGDTVIGQVRDGKRVNATMVNNSIALLPVGGSPSFFYRTNSQGAPASVFQPVDLTNSFFWPWDGVRTERGLYVFLMQVRHTADKSVWGFDVFATALAFVPNPDAPPQDWKITLRTVPFKSFGWAVLREAGYIYIYGKDRKRGGSFVARAPEQALDDFGQWRFYEDGHWGENERDATLIFTEAPPEGSVRWLPELRRFVAVYSPDIFGDIVMRTAESPAGPWRDRRVVCHCDEGKLSRAFYCYAGKMHPELSRPGELIVTYAVNSNDFSDLFNDARIYWPRFVRLNLP
jgi:hypothetical protein